MTDTPRTTTMEERHLWAQSILDGDYETLGQRPFLYRDALIDAHADRAALRDRLARQEHMLTVVDSILGNEVADEPENWRSLKAAQVIIRDALAPTDGAVPPRHNGEGDD
jgi:hypothetical protein